MAALSALLTTYRSAASEQLDWAGRLSEKSVRRRSASGGFIAGDLKRRRMDNGAEGFHRRTGRVRHVQTLRHVVLAGRPVLGLARTNVEEWGRTVIIS
jgi:hypothetical protein